MTASHVPHGSSSRAATPFDNAGSEISNFGLTSLSPVPYPPQQTHVLGTRNITSTCTQSEEPSQQTNIFASERGGYGNGLVQVHVHGAIHNPLSSAGVTSCDDTRSRLPNGSPQLVSDTDVDYSIHLTSETTGSTVGALQSIQSRQVEHVAVVVDASAPNAEGQSTQGCATPIFAGGITSDELLSVWPAFSEDVSMQLSTDLESQSHSIGPALSWVFNNDYTVPLQPQLPLIDYHPPEPPPSSIKSLNILKPPKNGRVTKGPSRLYECCESGGSQRFACLFYKHDPRLHMGCMSKSFTNIGHLRQHLDKSHKLGPNHCTSCWKIFDTADKLTNHTTTTQCTPIGGLPVDCLPSFPKMRMPADKKWYWGWKKLFGEAAALPQCPFFHPWEDLKAQFRAESLSPSQSNCPGRDLEEENRKSSYTSQAEKAPLSTSLDWQFIHDETLINITEGIAGLLPEDLSMSSSYPSMSMSPSTQSGDFDLDFDFKGLKGP
ncbi:hypothetical protein F4801DRAFT_555219 [Xylaria longipes]|nr:hypothetical protein F4801DRAFT_555219 [Xylaria longipes]